MFCISWLSLLLFIAFCHLYSLIVVAFETNIFPPYRWTTKTIQYAFDDEKYDSETLTKLRTIQQNVLNKFEKEVGPILSWIEMLGYTYRRREKKPRYAIEIWNVQEATMNNKPRTNNTTERWHKQLKDNVRIQYPPFYTIVKELQKQHANSNVTRNQLITGVVFKKRKEYADKDERVLNVVNTFKIDTVLDFLKNVNIAASVE